LARVTDAGRSRNNYLDAFRNVLAACRPRANRVAHYIGFGEIKDHRQSLLTEEIHNLLITRIPSTKNIVEVGATIQNQRKKRCDRSRIFFGFLGGPTGMESVGQHIGCHILDKIAKR
jgi:hypothetical protein